MTQSAPPLSQDLGVLPGTVSSRPRITLTEELRAALLAHSDPNMFSSATQQVAPFKRRYSQDEPSQVPKKRIRNDIRSPAGAEVRADENVNTSDEDELPLLENGSPSRDPVEFPLTTCHWTSFLPFDADVDNLRISNTAAGYSSAPFPGSSPISYDTLSIHSPSSRRAYDNALLTNTPDYTFPPSDHNRNKFNLHGSHSHSHSLNSPAAHFSPDLPSLLTTISKLVQPCTPPTSPNLDTGPMLNIHSTNRSRSPSPDRILVTGDDYLSVSTPPSNYGFPCCRLLKCDEACGVIEVICSDNLRYRKLLGLTGFSAQHVLDVMQMALDCDSVTISTQGKTILLKAILRLSKRSLLYPRSFVLTDVDRGAHPVASGHFGEVYQGEYNGRKVSLKAFKLYLSQLSEKDNLLKAFYKEAILWRHFNHRNLLPFYGIYQLGDSGGRICLVSPWMENGNITEYLKLKENAHADRNHLAFDVSQGIAYLHEQSVIHGDLKGANILISNSGVACLADFGLASIACKHSVTWTSVETTVSTAGTVRWQAPELLEENSLGATKESDMYAFACVLYEIYVGKVPFHEYKVEPAVIRQIMLGKRPTRPDSNSASYTSWGLTDWIWSLIEDCWQEDPAVRLTALKVVKRLSSVAGFSRPEVVEGDCWGELRSKAFKSLVDQQSRMTEEEMRSAISLLKSF